MKLSVLNQVRVSPGATPASALRDSLELAQLAEALGYERYWIAEHHGSAGMACPCPEVLLAAIGAVTSTIRIGAGGILLAHYSAFKVAECFRALDALHPGRIDLGIGRSAGAGPGETTALQRRRGDGAFAGDFEEQLTELLHFLNGTFRDGHPFKQIHVSPNGGGHVPVWLLGSSHASATLAASLGLPYAFAQFICPQQMEASCRRYQLQSNGRHDGREGRMILAVSAVCVESEAELRQLVTGSRDRPAPTANLGGTVGGGTGTHPVRPGREWEKSRFIGTPDKIRPQLCAAAAAAGADELMLLAPLGDADTCKRSYRLLAETFNLTPR